MACISQRNKNKNTGKDLIAINSSRSITKTIRAQKFWADLDEKSARKEIPLKATYELTYQCNLSCRHCYIPKKKRSRIDGKKKEELSYSEACSVLDQLAELGCFHLNLTGGEPLSRPDFFRILVYAKRKGFYVILLTNATLITSSVADGLRDLIDRVDITLYGLTAKTFQEISRIPGSLTRCLEGIQCLKKRHINMTIKMMVMTLNLPEFDRIKTFADNLGVRFQWDYLIHPQIDGSQEPLQYRIHPEAAIDLGSRSRPQLPDEEKICREKIKPIQEEANFFDCSAGKNSLLITPYGEMNLCLEYRLPGYDLRRGSVAEGWRELVKYIKSLKPDSSYQCRDCELEQYCHWCPSVGLLEEGNIYSCSPYYRELARLRRERAKG